jgi:membrane protease YdiL (CAAX protease family)
MLIPMIIPIFYGLKFKRESLMEIIVITFVMFFIVITYWPLTLSLKSVSNIIVKFLLFVLIPLLFLYLSLKIRYMHRSEKLDFQFQRFGISFKNFKRSLKFGFLFLPLMLFITLLVKYMIGDTYIPNFSLGIVSFFESFSEEFFFRGILFLYLMSKTNLKIAFITSFFSFILMHPQNFTNLFIISTIIQGLITI